MKPAPGNAVPQHAATTRAVLLSVLLAVMVVLTGASFFMVGHRLREQVGRDFSQQLLRSVEVFSRSEEDRLHALTREADLLADLPSLKALMTTDDDATIQDGALEFWRTSGNDLFALTDRNLRVRAAYASGLPSTQVLHHDLSAAAQVTGRSYLVTGGRVFHFAVAPIYFGNAASGTLLGYAINGDAVDTAGLGRLAEQAGANAVLLSGDTALASSTALSNPAEVQQLRGAGTHTTTPLLLSGARTLAISRDLSAKASRPLRLVFFRSLAGPDREIRDITQLLLATGTAVLLAGSLLMVLVARGLTQPLENLTRRVRAFGTDGLPSIAPAEGTREVRQLAADFTAMQARVEQANRARLESERLATIGSMASSVSHDLRHYLASIYANAEFLAMPNTSEAERADFFRDIQAAVMGTTGMLESLMIFGRIGQAVRRAPERLDMLTRRAAEQVRMHPDAAGVTIAIAVDGTETAVLADGKQIERALYNLLLNACQATPKLGHRRVAVDVVQSTRDVSVCVTDCGSGVPPAVQDTLFEPFISEGKHNGTGLGLTLCRCIAEEHGGQVSLVSSAAGATVFRLSLPRLTDAEAEAAPFAATAILGPGGLD